MDKISVEIEVNKKIEVEVDLSDVIDTINFMEMKQRWNCISRIINHVHLGFHGLTEEQKEVVNKYLQSKLSLLDK